MSMKDLLEAVRSGAISPEDAKRALAGDAPAANATTLPVPAAHRDPLTEPIAIVGMSARYPGAPDLDRFWALLASGVDAVVEIPDSRWPAAEFYDPSLPREGKLYAKWLGLLDDIDRFDPLFFAISPGEADYMDPQHRLFMEEAYRAFEDAGRAGPSLGESRCGVYFGIMSREYGDLLMEHPHLGGNTTGMSGSIGAARIPYFLNLKGPAIPIDTACSSSLVAAHLACQALRTREIDLALVGGATVYLSPRSYAGMCAAGMLSPSGRCRAFDDGADGFVPGEGVGAIVLKRLSDAEADRDHIHGLIVASGINQDGRTNGITAPSKSSQIALTREIYRRFDIDPATIGYVEMHGTGTNLGDPIELSALATTFRDRTPERSFCAIGSVKTNLGHTSAAAGVAGIHKVLLCMRHGMLVPSLHFDVPNKHFDFAASPFRVSTVFAPWEARDGQPRRGAVSSFGYSGTNAHLVLEEYVGRPAAASQVPPHVFPFSATDADALRRNVAHFVDAMRSQRTIDAADIAYTLQVGRAQREARLCVLADDRDALLGRLDAILAGRMPEGVWRGEGSDSLIVRALADRDDLADIQRGWLAQDPARLAELWALGLDADWATLRRDTPARRVPLPTYRFAPERYWLDFAQDDFGRTPAAETSATRRLRFDGSEFFLDGHRVGGRRVLPAAHCLELARAALVGKLGAAAAHGVALSDVLWRRPIVAGPEVDAGHPLIVEAKLLPRDGGIWAFELCIGDTVHCTGQGRALRADEPAGTVPVSSPDTGTAVGTAVSTEDLYALLTWMGIEYGAENRGLVALQTDADGATAILQLPTSAPAEGFALHPTMLDSALQATLGLALHEHHDRDDDARASGPSLPFSLDALRVFAPTTARMVARLRNAGSDGALRRYDLDLFEADERDVPGRLCVQLRGFAAMAARDATAGKDDDEAAILHRLAPVWHRVADATDAVIDAPLAGVSLIVGADAAQYAAIAAQCAQPQAWLPAEAFRVDGATESIAALLDRVGRVERVFWCAPPVDASDDACASAIVLFELISALLARDQGVHPLDWSIAVTATQAVTAADPVRSAHATLPGLVGAMAKEYPHWTVRMLDLDEDRVLSAAALLGAPVAPGGEVAALREDGWWMQRLVPVEIRGEGAPVCREDGLYVVVGGAGGVGEAWTEWMIRRHRAQVVWVGRRAEDDALRERADRLAAAGPRPWYISADATDRDALAAARDAIHARFPGRAIDGVVHAAIVLDDAGLANMGRERFLASLRAKVDIAINLERVFADASPDLFLFFSSMQSFTRNAGQGNYAAGCTFKDAFARALAQRTTARVKTVNWGYWGGTGIVATDAHRARMASIGLGSIEPEEGMAALDDLLASPLPQLGVLKTLSADAADAVCAADERMTVLLTSQASVAEAADDGIGAEAETDTATVDAQAAFDHVLAELLRVRMIAVMASQGVDGYAALMERIEPQYHGWLAETVRVLGAHGLGDDDRPAPATSEALDAAWAHNVAALRAQPATGLVEATLDALPGILSGAVPATDVVFHDPSMEQVEDVYRGTPIADHYNAVLADALLRHLAAQPGERRDFRILEIGAGTGGTSALLFDRLAPLHDRVAEYRYTDLSRAFLLHAETQFRPVAPYLACSLLDIEKPVAEQGIVLGGYDAVVATNVLHATRDIRNAIRNAKAALAPGGVLLLNEISRKSLFAHLTFGLLKGWWLAEDTALRIVGSPALAPDTWAHVLRGEGFAPVRFPAAAAHANGQQVVAAYSDGAILQRTETVATPAPDPVPLPTTAVSTTAGTGTLRERVAALVADTVGTVLRMDPARIDPRARLERYGLDSILAVQMTAQLTRTLEGVKSTLFIEYQTLDALVEHLLSTRRDDLRTALCPDGDVDDAPTAAPAVVHTARTAVGDSSEADRALAIVAISGRFPKADSPEALWERVMAGESCLGEVPASRWDHALYFDEDRSRLGKTYCRWGGFIDGVDEFDPLFFDFSPAAADCTDPQVRLFLQTTWDLFERAGMTRESLERDHGSRVGVFVGAMYQQYQTLEMDYVMHAGLSLSSYSAICNRVSNFFDFKGPSVAVDTQCSSGLIAVHMARQSLLAGECDVAVAGAVNLILTPKKYIGLSIPMMLGSHDRCRAFNDGGDGFLPSEGVGAVLLKPLARAVADGDPVLAVLRTTTQSHGGRGIGYGTQDPNAKHDLIARCLDQSGLDPASIGWVEAAATGNAMSDAMEASALIRAFSERTPPGHVCAIGTVKSNLGHSESASGLAQLLKTVMQLQHRTLPPLVPIDRLNRDIAFDGSPFRLQLAPAPWPRATTVDARGQKVEWPRRALIDCFGGGGSLACAIVEEYAPELPTAIASACPPMPSIEAASDGEALVVLSAHDGARLRDAATRLRDALASSPTLTLADVAYTLQVGREAMACRLALRTGSLVALQHALGAWLDDGDGALSDRGWRSPPGTEAGTPVPWDAAAEAAAAQALAARDLDTLALWWCRGARVDWRALHAPGTARIAVLPGYPFERRRCWLPDGGSPDYRTSLSKLDEAYRGGTDDAALDLPAAVHREIGAVLGLQMSELPLDAELVRFELPQVLIPRLRHHLQRRLDLDLDEARLAGCRTVGDVLDLVAMRDAEPAPDGEARTEATAAKRKAARTPAAKSPPAKKTPPRGRGTKA